MERLFNEVLRHLPDRLAMGARSRLLKARAATFGDNSTVARGCRILAVDKLRVGTGVTVARDVTLDARGGLQIGDGALVGFESVLLTYTHRSDEIGRRVQEQGMYQDPVIVGERAWLGMRVLVMPGVTIGADSIVGAGSVVTKDVPARVVVAGAPARPLRPR